MKRLILVRHGQTTWNVEDRLTSRTDAPLTPHGEEQARALGAMLHEVELGYAVASPLSRARRTAELILAAHPGAPALALDERLVETDCGPFEGMTETELTADPAALAWRARQHWPAGCETDESAAARARLVFAELAERDGTSLVVSHGHFIRVLLSVCVFRTDPAEAAARFKIANSRFTVVEIPAAGPRLTALNATVLP